MASDKAAVLIGQANVWVQIGTVVASGKFRTASINLANVASADVLSQIAISSATVAASVAVVDTYVPGKLLKSAGTGSANEFERTAALILPGESVWAKASFANALVVRLTYVDGDI